MEIPAPDARKLLQSWMEWERGDVTPGRVMANLKTGGLRQLLEALVEPAAAPPPPPSPDRRRHPERRRENRLPGRPSYKGGARGVRAEVPRPVGVRPGAPASWSRLPAGDRRRITLADVGRALAARSRASGPLVPRAATALELPYQGDTRPAAVLCLLFEEGGEANVVLTRRSAHLRSHGGEVSFPGGRLRPGELPVQAALREANEEIGLDCSGVEVIGELPPLSTRLSPALVYCFVGTFPGPGAGGQALTAQASEVDKVFWAALAGLAADGVFHEELWPAPVTGTGTAVATAAAAGSGAGAGAGAGTPAEAPPVYRPVPFFVVQDEVVWGATGRLLVELLDLVLALRRPGGFPEGTLVN